MSGSPRSEDEHQGFPDEEVLELRGDRRAPLEARRATRAFVDGRLEGPGCDEALLLVSELVTNAVLHAAPPVTVRLHISAHRFRVEVTDGGSDLPVVREPTRIDDRGRGMHIVAHLADRWGVDRIPNDGKTVWAEVRR